MRLVPLVFLTLLGCPAPEDKETGDTGAPPAGVDADGDGVTRATDCDDTDPGVYPGAEEVCDGRDNDCDREIDDGLDTTTFYADGDGDGWGSDVSVEACAAPEGFVAEGGDCDDASDRFHPGAVEDDCTDPTDYNCDGSVAYADADGDGFAACQECDDQDPGANPAATETCDGDDDDCDGLTDEADAADATTWYRDEDGDGYGVDDDTTTACTQPDGYAALPGDCDDTSVDYRPDAPEDDCSDPADYNCDGSSGYADLDGDGWAACEECDDGRGDVSPAAVEVCNGIDDDCDGRVDADATDATIWYPDGDGDGFGDAAAPMVACTAPEGHVAVAGDCDDGDPAFNPGAVEDDCTDPADYDCDGEVAWADLDGDGAAACEDCDDLDAASFPGADERCGGADEDCDGVVDEADAVDAATWYADGDDDGWGDEAETEAACEAPEGFVALAGDCDDADPAYNPGAVEDDCADPADYNCDGSTGYADGDGDGWAACEDCDDGDADAFPGATETCDGTDDDCDGTVDEPDAADASRWYADVDGDRYGNAASSQLACTAPTGFVADATDCDDTRADVRPSGIEVCDGVDQDCDRSVDEDAADASTWYRDADRDHYGSATETAAACEAPAGYIATAGDCDDGDAAEFPGADETCDGDDDDCDGSVDEDSAVDAGEWFRDADRDGYGDPSVADIACDRPTGFVATGGDCDDTSAAVSPAATEVCNGVDDDCDGRTDPDSAADASTWYADADRDGFGDPASPRDACAVPTGFVADASDCDDAAAAVNPDATEVCNDLDDDCDGVTDPSTAAGAAIWFSDGDGDGWGTASTTITACDAPRGYVAQDGDCVDGDAAINPGATEACNGTDDDCDGVIDPDGSAGSVEAWVDADGDGYGVDGTSVLVCAVPRGYATVAGDCADDEAAVNPGEPEVCDDGWDNDCDGTDNGCAVTGSLDPSDADLGLSGEAAYDALGYAVTGGDVDGDADADLLVSAIGWDASGSVGSSTGRVYVWEGPLAAKTDLGDAVATASGTEESALFGAALAVLPDRGGWLVGAPGADTAGADAGAVYRFAAGPSGALDPSDAVTLLAGEAGGEGLGASLAALGDLTGDGVAEWVAGAPDADDGADADKGYVAVVDGAAGGTLDAGLDAWGRVWGDGYGDRFGWAVAAGEDLDGDGLGDLAVGGPEDDGGGTNGGAVWVFLGGPASGESSAAAADGFAVGDARDGLGYAVALLRDADADGYADLLVGAPGTDVGANTDAGAAYLWLGGPSGPLSGPTTTASAAAAWTGPTTSDDVGNAVSSAGDVDADGTTDVLLGGFGFDRSASRTDTGAAWLAYGPFGGTYDLTTYDVRFVGDDTNDGFGFAVAGPGDLDGEGHDDWVVAGPRDDDGDTDAGGVFLFFGAGL